MEPGLHQRVELGILTALSLAYFHPLSSESHEVNARCIGYSELIFLLAIRIRTRSCYPLCADSLGDIRQYIQH